MCGNNTSIELYRPGKTQSIMLFGSILYTRSDPQSTAPAAIVMGKTREKPQQTSYQEQKKQVVPSHSCQVLKVGQNWAD